MATFKFYHKDKDRSTLITMNNPDDEDYTLSQILLEFKLFLRGCGYVVDDLEVINDTDKNKARVATSRVELCNTEPLNEEV